MRTSFRKDAHTYIIVECIPTILIKVLLIEMRNRLDVSMILERRMYFGRNGFLVDGREVISEYQMSIILDFDDIPFLLVDLGPSRREEKKEYIDHEFGLELLCELSLMTLRNGLNKQGKHLYTTTSFP